MGEIEKRISQCMHSELKRITDLIAELHSKDVIILPGLRNNNNNNTP